MGNGINEIKFDPTTALKIGYDDSGVLPALIEEAKSQGWDGEMLQLLENGDIGRLKSKYNDAWKHLNADAVRENTVKTTFEKGEAIKQWPSVFEQPQSEASADKFSGKK